MSALEAGLEERYRATVFDYYDRDGVHWVARPVERPPTSPTAWDLPRAFHVVTACNPASRKQCPAENAAANARLAERLRGLGGGFAPIDGRGEDGHWREPGFAVWNVPADALGRLMRELGQSAFFRVEDGRRTLAAGVHVPRGDGSEWLAVTTAFTLDDAVALISRAHRGQLDKGGIPYVFHPIRVALRLTDERERLAALLHDVVEDTDVSLDELRRRGVDGAVIEAVATLTKREGEGYSGFIERVARNPIARAVKLQDIADNLDPVRLDRLEASERCALLNKYEPARARLLAMSGRTAT